MNTIRSQDWGLTPIAATIAHTTVFDDTGNRAGDGTRRSRSWSKVEFPNGEPCGKVVVLRYRASLLEQLVRPLLRFRMGNRYKVIALPGPLFGAGEWTGYIPPGTDCIQLSHSPDRDTRGMDIEYCAELRRLGLVGRLVRAAPAKAMEALVRGAVGDPMDLGVRMGVVHHPLTAYHEWRMGSERPLDIAGIDRPQIDWARGVHVRYVCHLENASQSRLAETVASVQQQVYPHCSLAILCDGVAAPPALGTRVTWHGSDAASRVRLMTADRPIVFAPIVAGGRLPAHAAAAVAEFMAKSPTIDLLYADEDEIDPRGRYLNPRLKPDWSPQFHRSARYAGHALYIRDTAHIASGLDVSTLGDPARLSILFDDGRFKIGHLRRVLLTLPGQPGGGASMTRPAVEERPPAPAVIGRPQVSIVIPTKDKADLLAACLSGIKREKTVDFEVIVVDNGSREQATKSLFRSMCEDPRFHIQAAPGPFNFARLCNGGARAARSATLLFLNNDVEPLDEGWLAMLCDWSSERSVGAVGATLLYPSGRLQHRGLVLGLCGNAGHLDCMAQADEAGYLDRRLVAHEVAAVTGACLAVDRHRFDAVDGFDAEHFPVELNDVDLCLRLRDHGWPALMEPRCRLIHHESATRSRSRNVEVAYPREHEAFRQRWAELIVDDPYFHPALSLTSLTTGLG